MPFHHFTEGIQRKSTIKILKILCVWSRLISIGFCYIKFVYKYDRNQISFRRYGKVAVIYLMEADKNDIDCS